MFIYTTIGSGGGYRIYIPTLFNYESDDIRKRLALMHRKLKAHSIWGGHDKELKVNGFDCFGYEIDSWEMVTVLVRYHLELSLEIRG